MINLLRRHLLVSTTALFSLTLAPALVSALSAPLGASIVSVALADDDNGGNDDNGNDDNGSDDNGSDDDNGGNDDSGSDDDNGGNDDNGNDDNDNGTDDDASGTDDNGDDDNGVNDDSTDDSVDDNGVDDDSVDGRGSDDRTSLVVNDTQMRGLTNGTMVAVDQNGRRLGLEFEQKHNRTEVKIKAPRNSVTAVTIVPAN